LEPLGLTLMMLAPLLILWAQRTSSKLRFKKEKLTADDFKRGPYAFTRGPTHLGLGLLILGFGVLSNSLMVIAASIISYFISKYIFLKEQERLLAENYGDEYLKYQQEVDPWL
jgi:protein-S-isoprenylcysteine O-methyltransferase Ste14